MNIASKNLKITIGTVYLIVLFVGLFFLFSWVDLKDLASYEFIRSNKEIILKYKKENLLLLTAGFFIFSAIWVLFLGFAIPLLLFAGFVFGKWFGLLIILISTTMGTSCLYILASLFFKDIIREKLSNKFYQFKEFFNKNELLYFLLFRLIGGGGLPYALQNVLPVLFNISIRNYIIATFLGSSPSMFITIALGDGIENFIEKNETISILAIITSKDIYLPILGFLFIMFLALILKQVFFKKKINNES